MKFSKRPAQIIQPTLSDAGKISEIKARHDLSDQPRCACAPTDSSVLPDRQLPEQCLDFSSVRI